MTGIAPISERRSPPIVDYRFQRAKYRLPVPADAGRIEVWDGFVRDSQPHRLDFVEILLLDSGSGSVTLDGRRSKIGAGSLIVTRPGEMRRFHLDHSLQGHIVLVAPERRWPAVPGHCIQQCGHSSSVRAIERLMAAMADEVRRQQSDVVTMLTAQAVQLGVLVARLSGPNARPESRLVTRFRTLVDRRFRAEHRVSAYARLLGVTADHLAAVVSRETLSTPHALLRRRQIAEAQDLLNCSDLAVGAVAEAIGFDDASHFSRVFRRACAISPSRYRRRSESSC